MTFFILSTYVFKPVIRILISVVVFSFQIAVVEGLYFLFRELLPGLNARSSDQAKVIEDSEVFEYANVCWAYLIDQGQV